MPALVPQHRGRTRPTQRQSQQVGVDIGVDEVGGVAALLVIGVDAPAAVGAMLLMRMLSIGTALAIALATIVVVRDEFRALLRERARLVASG